MHPANGVPKKNLKCHPNRQEPSLTVKEEYLSPGGEEKTPSNEEIASELYDLYPRKVSRVCAIKQIQRALKKYPAEKLRAATARFAECWQGRSDIQFCPHPATWFYNERFNEDPAIWVRKESPQALGPLHVQIDALDKAIKKHPCNPESTIYDEDKITPELREGYKTMKTKLARLIAQQTQAIIAS